ncbi:nucleotide exchange factor GrpE [Nanoarchaeota archaeon]
MSKDSKTKEDNKDAKEEIKAELKKVQEKDKKKKDPAKDKIAELTDDLQRVQAEFENYKKRCEKENHNFRDYTKVQLVKKFLTVMDSFEMAFKNTDNPEEFMKGVELIYSQFYNILKDEGLQPIEVKQGQKFDQYFHEVMLSEKSDKDDETILEELQKGYKLNENILRHSKVKVAKK